MPLINNLEIEDIFKNKNGEKRVGIIDFIKEIIQIVKKNLDQLRIST